MAPKYFVMSFDDGVTQDMRLISILKKHRLKATFNINSGLLGVSWDLRGMGITSDHTRLSRENIEGGVYDGFEVAVHTLTHPDLTSLSDSEIIRQVCGDAESIELMTGKRPIGMAYPGGGKNYDERVISVISEKTDIKYARTAGESGGFGVPERFMEWVPSCHIIRDDLMQTAERFAAESDKETGLFFVWGHAYELDQYDLWERFEGLCAFMSGQDNIRNVTCGEFYKIINGGE